MWIMASELAGRVSASVPWVVVGGLLEVFTLCVSMTAVVGCGSRPGLDSRKGGQIDVELGEDAFVAPGGIVVVHRGVWRKVMGKILPGDPCPVDVEMALRTSRTSVRAGSPVGRRSRRACCQAVRVGPISAQRASEMSLGYARRAVTVEIYSGQSQRRSPPTRTAIHDQAHVRRNPRSIWSQNGRRPAFAATSIDGKSHGKRRIGCLTNRLSGQQIVECPLRCCSASPASDVDSIVRTFLFPGGGVVVRQARAGLWCGAQRPLDRLPGAVGRSQPGRVGRRPGRGSR
jgi:hypothetical protein